MVFWHRFTAILRFLLLAILLGLVIIACVQNRQSVSVNLMPLSYAIELPVFLLVLGVFTAAYAVASLQAFFLQLRLKRRIRRLQNRLQTMDADLHRHVLSDRLKNETLRDERDVPPQQRMEADWQDDVAPLPASPLH